MGECVGGGVHGCVSDPCWVVKCWVGCCVVGVAAALWGREPQCGTVLLIGVVIRW